MSRVRRARLAEAVAKAVMGAATLVVIGIALFLLGYLTYRGAPSVSWEFLSQAPRKAMTEGGIFPVIMGTVYLVMGTAAFALPIGIMAGVYLSEFAPRNLMTRTIRLAIANMAGVPSIVYGLFGFALFVMSLDLGVSVVAGALTLACLTLPVVITVTEESLRRIPLELRQASLALGASRMRTIQKVVLPAAAPGIVTGSILGLSRAAGETAPVLFTAVAFFAPMPSTPLDQTMALPYHLYIMATQAVRPAPHIVWGTAFVLVAGVSLINVIAAGWRSAQRRKIKW
ncbi:MAG: phosphate ABC transporter permease PstA [Actinomycetota bacterium]|jgi:phosphate transport system permease protein|nr:phosphate ABC transporter permease PstA [Actinomycetota bacterium]